MHPQIIKYGSPEYDEMLVLRTKILREPLGLTFSREDLEKDKDDFLLAIRPSGNQRIAACCILTPLDNKTGKLRQMAVDDTVQKSGLGTAMLAFAEYVAAKEGFEKITLHARKVAAGFYKKYDYKIVGDEFTEVGIPHYEMEKEI
ncbi:MAG: GNAT family N-acetyltransferase [Prevotella sp.]|jgi:predicted GNAT family N-acyltransferase|nr:GNAT family N-acetyltransferase [Prevotella sp.]